MVSHRNQFLVVVKFGSVTELVFTVWKVLEFTKEIPKKLNVTICFSKLEKMYDIVIGLLMNKVKFGRNIHAKIQI